MDTIVTQEDVNMFGQMFSKLSTIIVQASELGQKLPQLEDQITRLNNDCEVIRRRNQELDEELFNVRKQRDEAQAKAQAFEHDWNVAKQLIDNLEASASKDAEAMNTLRIDLSNARKDRDDHAYKCLELQDQLDKANAIISQFRSLLGTVPTPSPEPLPLAVPVSDPVVSVSPSPAPKRLYPGDEGYDWSEADQYDHDRGQWFMIAAA